MKSILGGWRDRAGARGGGVYGGRAADGGTGEFSPLGVAGDDGSRRHGRRSLSVVQRRDAGGDRRPILEAVQGHTEDRCAKLEPRPRAATRPPE